MVWITVQGTSARHRVGMVRTRIPQRAVTQQPRQKGNVAPWTGDLCLSGSGGFGSSRKAPCGSVQASLVIRSRAPTAASTGSNSVKRKSPGVPELPGPPEADPARGKGAAYGSAPS